LISKHHVTQLGDDIKSAKTILLFQPDSPDGDSLGSALGLEEMFGELGKQVFMYSYKAPESYLHGLEGWDRVAQDPPKHFDLTILVDTGSPSLIKSALEHHFALLTSKPFYIIDHHTSRQDFGFKTIEIVDEAVATSELITLELDWPINAQAADKLASALLSDSLGLTTSGTTAASVEALAELTRRGANLYELYKTKREAGALTQDLLHLKGTLLQSVAFYEDGKLAVAEIPPDVVLKYKDIAEPYTLILNEMQWAKGVQLVAVFKNYGTKINVPLRSTTGVASAIAERFDGGGHPNAAAYRTKTTNVEVEIQKLVQEFHTYLEETSHAAI
jgi:phosphoesterase RecJ-like protein